MKVKWDGGSTSYYRPGEPGNVKLAEKGASDHPFGGPHSRPPFAQFFEKSPRVHDSCSS